ncbi:MAG TPA: D-aminoacyl-tRNA deacylase [Saprospiraceae bacterium]|nr:D-aminoacyl-tRNA deacylase [Saprospiraceae bacterium]
MRAVIQLVSKGDVLVKGEMSGAIDKGLCVLVGFEDDDTENDMDWTIKKIMHLRIFSDGEKMNLNVEDIGGSLLIVSQFTLFASIKKGNRPSFIRAAKPEKAKELYERFVEKLTRNSSVPLAFGVFGAHMELNLSLDGPVTIMMDSKNKE